MNHAMKLCHSLFGVLQLLPFPTTLPIIQQDTVLGAALIACMHYSGPCLDEVQVVWNIMQWDGLSEGPRLLMGDQLLQSLLHELLQRVSGGRVPLPIRQQQLQLRLVILRSPARLQYACRVQQGGSVRSSCGSSTPAGHKWKAGGSTA